MPSKIKKSMSYTTAFKWFVVLFASFLVATIFTLGYLQNEKNSTATQLLEIKSLSEGLEKIDHKLSIQFSNGFVNINDIFVEFGDFKTDAINHIGLDDIQQLDSLSRIGRDISNFSLPGVNKYHVEIIHHIESLDALLIESDAKTFFTNNPDGTRSITTQGLSFKNTWHRKVLKIKRLFIQDVKDSKKEVNNRNIQIFYFSIFFITIFILLMVGILAYVGIVIFRDIKVLKVNSQLITSGKKPVTKNLRLLGESIIVNSNLVKLYRDIDETKIMLEMIQSDSTVGLSNEKKYSKNILYSSISKLETQLGTLKEKEKTRNWTIKGISELTEVVNQYSNDSSKLFDTFLVKLIKYIGAIQGGIFMVNPNEQLEMVSSYAFDRIKNRKKIIEKGEGLVGEVWSEEKYNYIENVPKDHSHVKSGLGHAKSTSLIIAPLIERNVCYGVVEVSSFKILNETELELILRSCEILAAATANIATNENTKKLLTDSQKLADEMKRQEEEQKDRISNLTSLIEEEQKRLYAKDRIIRDLRFEKEATFKMQEGNIKTLNSELSQLKSQIISSEKENEFTKKLDGKIDDYKIQVEDLNETIRIKNLKIERLKSKIEKMKSDKS